MIRRDLWRTFTHPSLAAFQAARATATLGGAIIGTVAIGACAGFLGGTLNVLFANGALADVVADSIMTPLRLVIAFLATQAFLFAIAQQWGGRGEFATQAYLSMLAFAPCHALALLADTIPNGGVWLAMAFWVYGVALIAIALSAAHGASAWRISKLKLLALSGIGGLISSVVISIIPQ